MGKFTLFIGNNGEYYFNLKAGNGEIIGSSEGYKAKASAENGIESVRKNGGNEDSYEVKEAENGKFHFNLKATNGQVILSSQMYATKASAENGIASVAKNAGEANVQDDTAAMNTEVLGFFSNMMSGSGASSEIHQLTNGMTENYNRHMVKLAEISDEAMKCHNVMDFMMLNIKATQYFYSDYMSQMMKLSSKFSGKDEQYYGVRGQ